MNDNLLRSILKCLDNICNNKPVKSTTDGTSSVQSKLYNVNQMKDSMHSTWQTTQHVFLDLNVQHFVTCWQCFYHGYPTSRVKASKGQPHLNNAVRSQDMPSRKFPDVLRGVTRGPSRPTAVPKPAHLDCAALQSAHQSRCMESQHPRRSTDTAVGSWLDLHIKKPKSYHQVEYAA